MTTRHFRKNLTTTTALVAAALLTMPVTAEAVCYGSHTLVASTGSTQDLTCAADTLTVNSGVILSGVPGVQIDTGSKVTNAGTVSNATGPAVYFSSAAALGTLSNSGTIAMSNDHA